VSLSSRGDGCVGTTVIHYDDVNHLNVASSVVEATPNPVHEPKTATLARLRCSSCTIKMKK
jgi:hypothetical protein